MSRFVVFLHFVCIVFIASAGARAGVEQAAPDDETGQRIGQLIAQLGHDDYFERERAQRELLKVGMDAFDALTVATTHDDIEIAARARYLVRLLKVEWTRDDDPEPVRTLLKDYDSLDETTRLERMDQLLELPDDQGLPAMCRIVRFEKSPLASKQAALKIITQKPLEPIDWNRRAQIIETTLGSSPVVAAHWLRLEIQTRQNAEGALEAWSRAVAAEETQHARAPQVAHSEVVATLLRRQIDLLEQLHRDAESQAAMVKLLDYERGTADSLARLLVYLADHKAWQVIDLAASQFAGRIEGNPFLLHAMSEVRARQGRTEVAEELAAKALELSGGDQLKHWQLGRALRQRGFLSAAEREYRRGIGIGPAASITTVGIQTELAEMLHDMENHLAAAQALEPAVAELERNAELRQALEQRDREVAGIHSRMLYFHARHHADAKDLAKQIETLEQAVQKDPTDADVLIALYRLPNQDEARRKKVLEQIRAATEVFRKQIVADPDDPTAYNQLAWLVSNTEGDQNEAVRCSLRSLELLPTAAGYMDTLGRCYYALGDYAKAVHHQSRAVRLEPHSAQMQRQLELFRQALAKESQKGKGQ